MSYLGSNAAFSRIGFNAVSMLSKRTEFGRSHKVRKFIVETKSWNTKYQISIHRKGLYISDVPLHDATRDLVLLSEKFEAEYKLTRNLEILTDKLQQTYRELDSEKRKTDRLLYSVLPESVANELRHQRPVAPKR